VDRATVLRRAGVAALLPLASAPAALAEALDSGFAGHPRWRFVLVSHRTTDPLLVATQFGAQDAASLLGVDVEWTGAPSGSVKDTIASLQSTIASKPDGIAVSRPDPPAFDATVGGAVKAGIPLVSFDVGGAGRRLSYVGQDHYSAGRAAAAAIAAAAGTGDVLLLAPQMDDAGTRRRIDGARRELQRTRLTASLTQSDARPSSLAAAARRATRLRAILAFDATTTALAGAYVQEKGLAGRVYAGGFDLLPNHHDLVAGGYLDFVVDMQPYLLGFLPVLLLFLQKISQGIVVPANVEIPPRILRASSIDAFLKTASRFEGSSSRHRYPLERA